MPGQTPFLKQYKLLLWKNFTLRRRRPILFIIEILAPVLIIFLLAAIRTRELSFTYPVCHFQAKPLPSAGLFRWFHGIVCTYNNTCFDTQTKAGLTNASKNLMDLTNTLGELFNKENSETIGSIGKLSVLSLFKLQKLRPLFQKLRNSFSSLNESLSISTTTSIFDLLGPFCGVDFSEPVQTKRTFIEEPRKAENISGQLNESDTCSVFKSTLHSGLVNFIYSASGLKNLFEGTIYYTPDTLLTRKIIKKANYTFEGIANLLKCSQAWQNFSQDLNRSLSTEVLRNSISKFCFTAACQPILDWLDTSKSNESNYVATLSMMDSLFLNISTYLECFNWNKFVGVDSESYFNVLEKNKSNIWAGIVFDFPPDIKNSSSSADLTHISVRIRMSTRNIDSTWRFKVNDRTFQYGPRNNPLSDMKYFSSGFIYIQEWIGRAIEKVVKQSDGWNYAVHMQHMSYPCFTQDRFTKAIAGSLPLFMVIGWIFSVSMTVKAIVYEKERRLKEIMRVMGLSNGIHWCGWLTTTLCLMTISILVITIFLKYASILPFSSPTVIFFIIFSFAVSTIAQSFFISVFFDQANIAASVAGVIYFMSYLPFSIVRLNEERMSESMMFAICLFNPVAFGISCRYIATSELSGIGVHWNNFYKSPANYDSFNIGKCVAMFWVDALIYAILTWYIEAVFPGEYGIPKKWYFMFTRSYWFKNDVNLDDIECQTFNTNNEDYFEAEPHSLIKGVEINNLFKIYGKSKIPAVNGLTINFYEDQITSFLGHNGAGKTTTISILTGLYPPTSGSAMIYGKSILTDINIACQYIGLCPQYNLLFDFMTVEEHIYFYGILKGLPENKIEEETDMIVKAVDLPYKRKDISIHLSGGMKRKLSVAMAFVGGSKVVILDEPTAGVDPFSRRSIWELLVRFKKGRTIILTTHHMDEADILGDRIAIISKGKLKCCGSSVFLKNLLGGGYYLILATDTNEELKIEKIKAFIKKHVNGALLVENNSSDLEYVFKLPSSGLIDKSYERLFLDLDNNLKNLNITCYGLSDTSLENIFLQVADDPSGDVFKRASISRLKRFLKSYKNCFNFKKDPNNDKSINKSDACKNGMLVEETKGEANLNSYSEINTTECIGKGTNTVTGLQFLVVQFQALWIKRFHYMRRNIKGFIAEIIVPPFFILVALALMQIVPKVSENPAMELHPWLMEPRRPPPNLYVFFVNNNMTDISTTTLTNQIKTPLGCGGVRCMNSSIYSIKKHPCIQSLKYKNWNQPVNYSVSPLTLECQCSKGKQQICTDNSPQSFMLPTQKMASTDYLMDLKGYNVYEWLVKTYEKYKFRRYGGYQFTNSAIKTQEEFISDGLVNFFLDNFQTNGTVFFSALSYFVKDLLEPSLKLEVFFNNKGYPSSTAYLNILQNILLRTNLSNANKSYNLGISVVNHPLSASYVDLFINAFRQMASNLLLSICVIFSLAFIPASFLLFLIDERVTNSKHLQFVSGVNPYVYWAAIYLWDIINYIFACMIVVLLFISFNMEAYVSREAIGPFILLLFLYGSAIIPLMYPGSFIFRTPSSAVVVVSSINLAIGMITTLAVFILTQLERLDAELKLINDILKIVFLIFPQYCLGKGLLVLAERSVKEGVGVFNIMKGKNHVLAWDQLGLYLVCLIVQCLVFLVIVLLIEKLHRISFCKPSLNTIDGNEEEDEDVIAERERVLSGEADKDAVRLVNLTKIYRGKRLKRPAVNSLCMGMKRAQCFGLLGINGAGKTSTFMMLTGQQSITKGNAFVGNKSVKSEIVEVHKNIGYCPQFDALNNLLTGRETLQLYARLRGVPSSEIAWVVNWALERLSLMPHADKLTGAYSGGNKRKLSTAIALIGNPSVIFLDEPTSGMDPGAKRFLWNCILEIVQEGRSVVLTTHSMEECEALCQRLCIMVNGTIRCIGSVQHLKSKFGDGYTVSLKLNNSDPKMEETKTYMNKNFPGCVLQESNYTLLQYKVNTTTNLSTLFKWLQKGKAEHNFFADYSVSQTTLDQVFINFARNQTDITAESNESHSCLKFARKKRIQKIALDDASFSVRV